MQCSNYSVSVVNICVLPVPLCLYSCGMEPCVTIFCNTILRKHTDHHYSYRWGQEDTRLGPKWSKGPGGSLFRDFLTGIRPFFILKLQVMFSFQVTYSHHPNFAPLKKNSVQLACSCGCWTLWLFSSPCDSDFQKASPTLWWELMDAPRSENSSPFDLRLLFHLNLYF